MLQSAPLRCAKDDAVDKSGNAVLRLAILVAVCAVWPAGCKRGTPSPPASPVPSAAPENTNVVWLVADAAAARYFGCYGNELEATPAIDRLAAEATVFKRAYAQAAWTLPSVASYLVGKYPPLQGTKNARVFLEWPVARILRRAGFRTAAFSENPYVTRQFGFAAGFEHFDEFFPHEVVVQHPRDFVRTDSERTVEAVCSWLDRVAPEPFFLYVHLLPPHAPYNPPPPFSNRFDTDYAGSIDGLTETLLSIEEGKLEADSADLEHLRRQYQENLAFADHQLGRILQELRARGLFDRCLIVVTSDHGEAFFEHGHMQHNWTVYEEMIHVPLIIRFPPLQRSIPLQWDGVVELVDLVPTIAELLGLNLPDERIDGRSLLGDLHDRHAGREIARSWTAMMPNVYGSVIMQRYKLIVHVASGTAELYDLQADPGETTDITAARPRLTDGLRELLELRSREVTSIEIEDLILDDAVLERIRALGYTD